MKGSLSPEDKALIEELRAQGLSLRGIGKRIRRCKTTVRSHLTPTEAKQSGRPKRSEEADALIRDRLEQGATHTAIAAELGITKSTALRWAQQIGAKSKFYFDWTPEADATLQRLISEGKSYAQASSEMGITLGMAIGRARRLQIKSNFQPSPKAPGVRKPRQRAQRKERGLSVVRVGEAALPPLMSVAETIVKPSPAPAPVRRLVPHTKPGEGCRYPLWGDDPNKRPTHRYCDAPRISGKSWCPEHFRIVFTKVRWGEAA